MDVKSADKRPEKYVGPDGKPRVRMVPADNQVIKKESAVDEVSLSAIKKAVQGSGLSNVKKAMPTDKLKKDLAKMKLKLATEGTLSEATDMNKLKQLAAAGLVQKTDVQKLLRVFAKMESGKTVTPAEREMLLGVLSDLTALITGDMSMLQKAKKAVKEDVELDETSLYDKIKAARANPSPDKPVRGRGSKNRNPKTYDVRNTLDKEDDRYQDLVKKRLQKKNEETELDEGIEKMSHGRLKWHMNTGVPHGSYSKDEMKAERDRRLRYKDSADAYKKAKASMSEETELDEGLGHISAIQNMMAKEREAQAAKKKKYTAPTQAEIDADRKKDQKGKPRPSMSAKSANKKQYSNYMAKFKEAYDEEPASPDEKSMAMRQAKFIQYVGEEIMEHLEQDGDFPEWMQNKLSEFHQKAKDMHSTMAGSYEDDEEEMDEAVRKGAPKMQGDFLKKERERNRAHDAAMGRTPTGRKKPVRTMTSTQRSLAKMRNEEVQIDEVLDTPKAMDSYRNKAKYSRDRAASSAVAINLRSKDKDNREHPAKDLKTMAKRTAGLRMADKAAVRKTRAMLMKKEEVQLDELSPNTLHSYIKGASKDLAKRSRMSGYDDKRGNYADGDKNRKRANKRMAGIASASGRMADKANMAEEYVNEKLKVSHGMGAWIDDFKKSDAPQFKGKSDKERRDMAIAAFLSAKRGN